MQTLDQLSNAVFRIHEKGRNTLSKVQVEKALKFEGLLYFNHLYSLTDVPEQLHLLLQGMHKLGKKDLHQFHFALDVLNLNYAAISGKRQFTQAMRDYQALENNLRLFDLNHGMSPCSQVDFYEERLAIYKQSFEKVATIKKRAWPKSKPNLPFVEVDGKKIDVTAYQLPSYQNVALKPKKGGTITVSIQTLKEMAVEMDQLIEAHPTLTPQSYASRMEKFQLLVNDSQGIAPEQEMRISEVCHIIGMVGTGKSTLIQVLSYYLAKNNYRTLVLFESIKDVLEHTYLFEQLGISSTAINGEKKQDRRVQKVIEHHEMVIPEKYSSNLLGSCYMSSLCDGEYDDLDQYGNEPCYRMKYKSERVLCPFYQVCPRKRNIREMQNASVIFANVHSFLFTRSGLIKDRGRLLLLEYAVDYMDVVIFDEADELQTKLDQIMNESAYTENLLKENLDELYHYLGQTIWNANLSTPRDLDVHFRLVFGGLKELKYLLTNRSVKNAFSRIRYGQWFSAYVLAQDLDFMPPPFVEAYKQVIEGEDQTFLGIKNAYLADEESFQKAFEKLYEKFGIPSEHRKVVQCLMAMVIVEKHMLSLQYEIESVQKQTETRSTNHLLGIFRKPHEDLVRLLPKSPTNNRFGFLFHEEDHTLQIFKQVGIGRSAMLDLPYLKIDQQGKPLGPHTILLSGSSFAAGSSAHHINRPVNYILEAPKDIQEFIEQVSIQYVKSEIAVSGKADKKAALAEMVNRHRQRFLDAQNSVGRTLLIVNSYQQAEWVQKELKKFIPLGVARVVPDHEIMTEDTIQRSKLNQVRDKEFKFLVAPAISIARGFNMVDEQGHSLFNKMFILVRPMSKPKEIQTVVSIVNGELMRMVAKQQPSPFLTDEFTLMKHCKDYAHQVWNMALQDYYGIQLANPLVKQNIIVSRLVLLMQLMGRLLRVTNLEATPPTIVLLDHAFVGRHAHSFDLLYELEMYLEQELKSTKSGQLVEKLYGPFLAGLKRGRVLV